MKTKEQLQAEIIEKQKEIDKAKDVVIEHYKNCMHKLTLYSPETIGYQEGVIKNIKSELSALTAELEKEGDITTCKDCNYWNNGGWDENCRGCYGYDKHTKGTDK